MEETIINFYQGQTDLFELLKEEDKKEENRFESIHTRISELFNMKNIHFLFGSGTSMNAIPSMIGLFDAVEEQINKLPPEKESIKLEFETIKSRVSDKNLEEILGILYSHKKYLEDYKAKQKEFLDCDTLIILIETVIFNKIHVNFSDDKPKEVLNNYKEFYRKVALRNKDLSRINVFTTNNDLFNETALDSLNIHYINGFNGGLNRYFNPALFNYTFSKRMDTSIDKFEPVENIVNLYKIHGSINWIEDKNNENTFFKIKEISEPKKTNNNILVYPTPTKTNKSLGSPYVEMFREFQGKLLEPLSVLFVIGYSFSDEHVNNIIYQALATNSTMNLVILNDVEQRDISKIEDDRIFRVWGKNEKGEEIHFFDKIIAKLLPNVNAFKSDKSSMSEFIKFYNNNLSDENR